MVLEGIRLYSLMPFFIWFILDKNEFIIILILVSTIVFVGGEAAIIK